MTFDGRRPARAALCIGVWGLWLGGCAMPGAPAEGTRADVVLPAAWTAPAPAQGPAVDDAWWASFHDAPLSRLVDEARIHNTTVAAAQANLRAARALRSQAAAGLVPSLSAGLTAQRNRGGAGASQLFDASLDASWEADLFGATRHSVRAQDALVRASAATLGATRVSVLSEVGLAYIDLRNAQARLAIARENLALQEETLQIARWRMQAGLASSLEVEQASATVEQTRAQVPLLQSSAASSAHALAVLVGQPPQALLADLTAPGALPQPASLAPAAPAEALRRRPDVIAAEERLQAAMEQTAQAQANRLPTLALRASVDWTGLTLGSLGSVAAARALVASFAAPLFDGGLRTAQVEQRQAQSEAAREEYRAAVLAALQDVEDALVALQATRDRLAALRLALDAARNASTLASQRYTTGVIDFLTVLETQRTLLAVQDAVAASQAELAAGQVRLYKALGGGWSPGDMENRS